MTFASEAVRFAYHALPTSVQVQYERMEHRLARREIALQVDGVVCFGSVIEVVVRVRHTYPATATISKSLSAI